MMVWRNSVTCTPDERDELKYALYQFITELLKKDDPKRKKYLKMYKAFKNAGKREEDDKKGK